MRSLSRSVGLGLAARGDLDDVVIWARRARDAGLDSDLDPRQLLRARRHHVRERDGAGTADWPTMPARPVPRRTRVPSTRTPATRRPGDDGLRAGRAAAWADRHGPRNRPAPAAQARWASRTSRTPRSSACRPRSTGCGRCGPANACRRRRPDCRRSSRCSRPRTASRSSSPRTGASSWRWPAKGGRLPGPTGRVDPLATGHPGAALASAATGPAATRGDRDRRAISCRSSTRPGARRSTAPSASRSSST